MLLAKYSTVHSVHTALLLGTEQALSRCCLLSIVPLQAGHEFWDAYSTVLQQVQDREVQCSAVK